MLEAIVAPAKLFIGVIGSEYGDLDISCFSLSLLDF